MNVSDFKTPDRHPYDMLNGYENAFEKESVLAIVLDKCIREGDLSFAVETIHQHPAMVDDGLLEPVGKLYRLTPKAVGLLYSQYHV